MNINKSFDSDLLLVKAKCLKTDEVVCGYYYKDNNSHRVRNSTGVFEVNPYAISRNSGIKDINGNYIFEYDLLKIANYYNQDEQYGYLVWEEFYKTWKIRRYTEFSSNSDVSKFKVEVVGNVLLCDADAEKIFEQDKIERERTVVYDRSYCPSCFKK